MPVNGRDRGYLSCEVRLDTWKADLWFVDDVLDAGSPVSLRASYVVKDGQPGANPM